MRFAPSNLGLNLPKVDVHGILFALVAVVLGAFATLAKPRDAAAVLKICFAGK